MKNNCKNWFCACMAFMSLYSGNSVYAQSVTFPQAKQPGIANVKGGKR